MLTCVPQSPVGHREDRPDSSQTPGKAVFSLLNPGSVTRCLVPCDCVSQAGVFWSLSKQQYWLHHPSDLIALCSEKRSTVPRSCSCSCSCSSCLCSSCSSRSCDRLHLHPLQRHLEDPLPVRLEERTLAVSAQRLGGQGPAPAVAAVQLLVGPQVRGLGGLGGLGRRLYFHLGRVLALRRIKGWPPCFGEMSHHWWLRRTGHVASWHVALDMRPLGSGS